MTLPNTDSRPSLNDEAAKSIQLLSEIGQAITSSFSTESIIDTTYDKVNGLMDASVFGIGIYNEQTQSINMSAKEKGVNLPKSIFPLADDYLSSYCFNNRREILISDYAKQHQLYLSKSLDLVVGEDPESIIYAPLLIKDNIIGVITVQSFQKNTYTLYHLSVLKIIAAYVATALENAKAYHLIESQKEEIEKKNQNLESEVQKRTAEINFQKEELEGQRDELQRAYRNIKLLSEVGQKITSCLTIEDIISKVYENVNTLMDATTLGIGIYNEEENRIDFPGTIEKGQILPFNYDLLTRQSLSTWCFTKQKEIMIGDYASEYTAYMDEAKIRAGESTNSIIYLPLNIKDKKLGVLTVQSFRLYSYQAFHLTLLRNLASYIAIAIENAEAYHKLNETLATLRSTQAQLIHVEKMASLGQLTAGVAHEIQNPLNFITNFSEMNNELIEELQHEKFNQNAEEQEIILNNIFINNEKINQHGRRADAIVKGMLQHSRQSSGEKVPTDINALAEEYLRLSYQAIRSKNNAFEATIETQFDESLSAGQAGIGQINIMPQDIGRVLLNLFNNAFYAVNERSHQLSANGYQPAISVQTKKINDKVEIRVSDNGVGIPQNIIDKIFQPFFTTKPTGEGTGLGLSLGYDIITKQHNGKIKVESTEGKGSEFIIQLPNHS